MSNHSIIDYMTTCIKRGAYDDAVSYAESLPADLRNRPRIVLEKVRARMRQGRMADAEAMLHAFGPIAKFSGASGLLALEAACLSVYRCLAIAEALTQAEPIMSALRETENDPAIAAEAERVYARILLIAATYYEISKAQGQAAHRRLPQISAVLEHNHWLDESLAAEFTFAQRIEDTSAALTAFDKLIARATNMARHGLAGEAHLAKALMMLQCGGASESIRAELALAAHEYGSAGHLHGPIEVRQALALLAIERERGKLDSLEKCRLDFQAVNYPKGELDVLISLSHLAYERGDVVAANTYRKEGLALANTIGMGLVYINDVLAQADIAMRYNDFGLAIEMCEAALKRCLPCFIQAGVEQLLATAYAFVNNLDKALSYGKNALKHYEDCSALDSAANAAVKLASDLNSLRLDTAWEEAESLLLYWSDKDRLRGDHDALVQILEMRAQIGIHRFLYSPTLKGSPALLQFASQIITDAEQVALNLSQKPQHKRLGNLAQLRGQLHQLQGNFVAVENDWREALTHYETIEAEMESANCRYMIGVLRLNAANQELLGNFEEAETQLAKALAYYEANGNRLYAANSRYMLALLYMNAEVRVVPELGNNMAEAAIGHLTLAEAHLDAVRRDFAAGNTVEIQASKRALRQESIKIYELALDVLLRRFPNWVEAWRWTQKFKARSLSDALTADVAPQHVEMARHPRSLALLNRESELIKRLQKAPAENRIALRQELQEIRDLMREDPCLADYLDLRAGGAVDLDDLGTMATETACVFLDWVVVGEWIWLIGVRPGEEPAARLLPLTASAVRKFIESRLNSFTFRSTLRDDSEDLDFLNPLLAPLGVLTKSGEMLVLCPSGFLSGLPLHALEVEGVPLIERNPVVYTPSLSVLRHCLIRSSDQAELNSRPVLFGDPTSDRPAAAAFVQQLEKLMGLKAFRGAEVTREIFLRHADGASMIHYQGHAMHDRGDALSSYLELADNQKLTARELFDLQAFEVNLVTLAACESGVNVIEPGDEPLGLVPAFLTAGARSVLASLWKVEDKAAAACMRGFYDDLLDSGIQFDKAQALRAAVLAVRRQPQFAAPYYWAPFCLYGAWT